MRGLKPHHKIQKYCRHYVASFTDAWIETAYIRARKDEILSHLLQMRGLKHILSILNKKTGVASFTDAWIETYSLIQNAQE